MAVQAVLPATSCPNISCRSCSNECCSILRSEKPAQFKGYRVYGLESFTQGLRGSRARHQRGLLEGDTFLSDYGKCHGHRRGSRVSTSRGRMTVSAVTTDFGGMLGDHFNGDGPSEKTAKEYADSVREISALETAMERLSDHELRRHRSDLQKRIRNGEALSSIRSGKSGSQRGEGKVAMGFEEAAQALQELITSSGGAAVLDGGLATELERKGADIVDPLWSAKYLIEDPDMIQEVHREYLESGADIILSASYQASLQGFAAKGLSREQGTKLLRLSVQIAKRARDQFWEEYRAGRESGRWEDPTLPERRRPLLGASVGPYAAYLADGSEYTGDYGPTIGVNELVEFHRERLRIYAQEQPDFLAFETIPCKVEGEAIVRLLEEEELGIPAWISFNSNDGVHVPSGDAYADCAALGNSCDHIVAVGVNCTAPRFIGNLLSIATKVTKKPLVVYPNCGETYDGATKQWVAATGACDEAFSSYTPVWRDAGAQLIGGCCRTTPHTIKCITAALKQRKQI